MRSVGACVCPRRRRASPQVINISGTGRLRIGETRRRSVRRTEPGSKPISKLKLIGGEGAEKETAAIAHVSSCSFSFSFPPRSSSICTMNTHACARMANQYLAAAAPAPPLLPCSRTSNLPRGAAPHGHLQAFPIRPSMARAGWCEYHRFSSRRRRRWWHWLAHASGLPRGRQTRLDSGVLQTDSSWPGHPGLNPRFGAGF